MEKENSSEEEPVGFPAPNSAIDADHNINAPTENDLSDNEMVGNTIEERVESKPDIHEEDQDMNPSTTEAKDEEIKSSNDMEIRNHEDDEISDNILSSEPDVQKEDQEKGSFVNGTTISGLEDDNIPTGEPDVDHKEDQEMGNIVNDPTQSCMVTDIEIRPQEEANFTTNTSSSSPAQLLNSENLTNDFAHEPDLQKENDEKGNTVNDTIVDSNAEKGEILDHVKENNDKGQSPKCAENIEMKSEDVSHTALSQKEAECSTIEETRDMKTDPSDDDDNNNNNTCKKEESLQLYRTQEAPSSAWPRKTSVLSKFVKLCTTSNIFRNNSNEKENKKELSKENIKEMSHTTPEKPKWSLLNLSLIKTSNDKNQETKDDQNEVFLESPELKPIKGRIILYTKLWCQNCKEARVFLRKRKLRYSEINIDMYPSRKVELEEITGSSDVPKVFFNQVLIGGLNELKGLNESGQLEEKIEYVTSEVPSNKAPLPPFSGEDDVSSKGGVDELAVIVRKMKASIVVKDRFYKFRRMTNCFLGSEVVDFLSEDQFLEREGAIEFARKLVKELFFRHVLEENTFEDGNHLYRFLDQDPLISQCQNIPRGIIQIKRQPLVELSRRLRFLLYAILDAYASEDGKHIAYRTIHGSEEFARYLRIAEELQRLDLNKTTKEERLAFFINLYNLMTIHAILVWGHPEGALDRRKLFNDFKYVIGGCAYSLSDIYNGILRANQRPPYNLTKPFAISDKRFKVALPYPEPLIHFALVSGSRSAPALRCYSPKNIDRELTEAARVFLQSGAFVLHLDSMTVSVTKILNWYSVDFGKNEVEILKHAANYLEVEKTQTLLELLDDTQLKVVYQPYDWRLNS